MQSPKSLVDVDVDILVMIIIVINNLVIIDIVDGGYKRSEPSTISSQSLKIPWI